MLKNLKVVKECYIYVFTVFNISDWKYQTYKIDQQFTICMEIDCY